MTDIQLFYVLLFALLFFAAVVTALIVNKRAKLLRSAYKLYAIRDELVWLVAQTKVDEEDPIFQQIYRMVNAATQLVEDFSMRSLVDALKDQTQELLQKRQRFLQQLSKCDPALQALFAQFAAEIGHIFWINSLLLRVLVRSHPLYLLAQKVYRALNLWSTRLRIYRQAYTMHGTYRAFA